MYTITKAVDKTVRRDREYKSTTVAKFETEQELLEYLNEHLKQAQDELWVVWDSADEVQVTGGSLGVGTSVTKWLEGSSL